MPGAVTLDLYGTLADFSIERDERPLVADLLAEADLEADPGRALRVWVRESLAERARTPFRTVRVAIRRGAERAARRLGLDLDPDRWAGALETLWATRPLREDARPALDRLEAAGVPTALVTNVDEPVLAALAERTGVTGRVDAVVTSHRARAYKPHPRAFRMALDRLGVPPGRAVHVGDSPGEDRAGARAAGMRAVLVDESRGPLEAVEQVLGD